MAACLADPAERFGDFDDGPSEPENPDESDSGHQRYIE